MSQRDAQRDIASRLINAGAKPDLADSDGSTPLHKCTNVSVLRTLLSAVPAPNLDMLDSAKRTPLFVCLHDGHHEASRVLIDSKANVNAGEYLGLTALSTAIAFEEEDIMYRLLEAGADPLFAAGERKVSAATMPVKTPKAQRLQEVVRACPVCFVMLCVLIRWLHA